MASNEGSEPKPCLKIKMEIAFFPKKTIVKKQDLLAIAHSFDEFFIFNRRAFHDNFAKKINADGAMEYSVCQEERENGELILSVTSAT